MSVLVVVNPAAGARSPAVRDAVRRWLPDAEVRATRGPGDASRWAAEAAEAGRDVVVAGGDGTVRDVLCATRGAGTTIGVVPAGTGNDLARGLGLPTAIDDAWSVACRGPVRVLDLMRIGLDGASYGANVVGFGLNGAVVRRVAARGGGYLAASVRSWWTWRAPVVRVQWDGPDGAGSWEGPLLAGFVANGAWCGGGMWVGRGGEHGDGVLELVLVPPIRATRLPRLVEALYDGGVGELPGVVRARVRVVEAVARRVDVVPTDLDGDEGPPLPLVVSVVPSAVRVRAPA